jgi:hypothetical protein
MDRKIFSDKDEGTLKPEKKHKKDEDLTEEEKDRWESQEEKENDEDIDLLSEDDDFMGW